MSLANIDLNLEVFKKFEGLSFLQIAKEVGLNPTLISPKTSAVKVLNKLLMQSGFDEKQAADKCKPKQLVIKTIKLNEVGSSKESMSFEQVNFLKLSEETWETSYLKKKFEETIFLFFVFQYKKHLNQESILYFRGVKIWEMPESVLNREVRHMWNLTHQILNEGVKLEEKLHGKKTITTNNLPGIRDNPVVHLRPKAKDGNDKVQIPGGQFITKQAYWINASYAAHIVKDLPPLKTASLQFDFVNSEKNIEFIKIKSLLLKEVYTINEFLEIALKNQIDINEMDINGANLYAIGFNVMPGVIVSESIGNFNEYLMGQIFKENYFVVPDLPVFRLDQVKRKINNLENAYQLINVGEGIYLTNRDLSKGGLDKGTIEDYKKAVVNFIGSNRFFTLDYLTEKGFSHEMDEYGFEPIFYESILKGQGHLKSIKVEETTVFIRTFENITTGSFVKFILEEKKSLSVEEFIVCARELSGVRLNYKNAILLIKSTNYFYSEDLEKVFRTKDFYYSEIFN
ncbi:type II restriction enzyme [Planococcus donghaensis MPA1U2]|uniref:Type II restriction enzyme n=1 Tax=Planococcus donghaensis MPA1U2 TaxID=933115 RepID=E7RCM1_9BACL|nr:MutH/Sau3AI family endonuclease [Planococcus donghaensis]EGA91386.1 type II restriction enzyme [Planococcus donghaensis MPA1U2]